MGYFKIAIITFLFVFGQAAIADSIDVRPFHKYLKIERDSQGQLKKIVLRSSRLKSTGKLTRAFLEKVDRDQKKHKKNIELIDEKDLGKDKWSKDERKAFAKAKKYSKRMEKLNDILNDPEADEVMSRLDQKLLGLSYANVLAAPHDPSYFMDRLDQRAFIEWAKRIVGAAIDNVPAYRVITFAFSEILESLIQRREFFQNFILFYLNQASLDALQITEKEARLIRSSIYVSRINWPDISDEIEEAEKAWDSYGESNHLEEIEISDDRMDRYENRYDYTIFLS